MSMMQLICFGLVWLLSSHSIRTTTAESCDITPACGCSRNPENTPRIVGGQIAAAGKWTWTVSISFAGISLCGGSIISDSWVVTAAHCFNDYSASNVKVYAGSNIRFGGSQNRTTSTVIVHPNFNRFTFENDIALIRLSSPLNMSDPNIGRICLPIVNNSTEFTVEWPPVNTSLVAVGWGRIRTNGPLSNELLEVTVPKVDHQLLACSLLLSNRTLQFCAGYPGGGKDTCQGDSGGPLMFFDSLRRIWLLAGLTSTGADCASPSYSAVYTNVIYFYDWIQSHTNVTSPFQSTTVSTLSSSTTQPITTIITEETEEPIISRATTSFTFWLSLVSVLLLNMMAGRFLS